MAECQDCKAMGNDEIERLGDSRVHCTKSASRVTDWNS
eukprot:CAMPEP_0174343066 /NCGR_PEP_ID=MMETSP0810-20121108/26659_1 /TAXON_ID=73025 ORGANISM="Eutreptiella gymnastica-like, Strain CCMP1594" /NCGR_SAMPLE_ID=MMETSP0810 /ASSEMBLY_ACC=CAM_ASM_000659 /LENGTH=37 /DNA_ID= /DNA_START= /DNA_END= /DNA_ORIENTATION=